MKKFVTLSFLVVFAAVVVFAAAPPATVKIDAAKAKQPGVTFPHEKHLALGKSCDTCHHTQKGMTKDTKDVAKCETCHLKPAKAETPNMAEMSMTKNPFHALCINCHKTGKKGPTVCKDCHKA